VERRLATFYLPKLILVGCLWVCAIILASWQKMNATKDPLYNYVVDAEKFHVRKTKTTTDFVFLYEKVA